MSISKCQILLGLSLLMIGFVGCRSSSPASPTAITVNEQNAGSTIEVRVGQTLKVTLQGNPSTGYAWIVDTLEQAILRIVGESQFTPDSDAIGAGGKITLSFQAVAVGQTTLRLIYRRPWETDAPPLNTFEAAIVVK